VDDVIRFFFFGITAGSAYALLGLGIVLIYRGSGVLNFSQGAVGFFGLAAFHEARPSMGTAGALVFGVVTWQAFGWFDNLRNVVLAALAWATLITGWLKIRRRLYDRAR